MKKSEKTTEEVNVSAKQTVLEMTYDGNTVPVVESADGIRFDYNCGLRLQLPERQDGERYFVVVKDRATGTVLFADGVPSGGGLCTPHKYFVDFQTDVYGDEDAARKGDTSSLMTSLRYYVKESPVLFLMDVRTIGDTLAWFPYILRFAEKHRCIPYVCISRKMRDLLQEPYQDRVVFIDREELPNATEKYRILATYKLGIWWNDDFYHTPADHRLVGLAQSVGMLLGVDPTPERVMLPATPPEFAVPERKYVCISVQSTTQAKNWTNPKGWYEVVKHLRGRGYDVYCIDRDPVYGQNQAWSVIPWGVEDRTGDIPLIERMALIKGADFFIGLASGLSWLAWACDVPVIMISGFSDPVTEFPTPYRVINRLVCNSCWNDPRYQFDHNDFEWCPRHKGTDRQWECMRQIHPKMVIDMINKVIADNNLE